MRRRAVLLTILLVGMAFPVRGEELEGAREGPAFASADASTPSSVESVRQNLPIHNWLEHVSQPLRRLDLEINSAASCASTACHGGPRPGIGLEWAVRGNEYPLWLENDPHARSWRTMCSQVSVDILERLSILQDGKVRNQAAFDNCLKCHNTTRSNPTTPANQPSPSVDNQDDSVVSKQEFHAEGVGCASCHGPAERWLKNHYRTVWNDFDSSELGLVPNRNLLARARGCAACHIGDRDRDVNHDLIAAGHPALHYEFATYHNMLPKHWREEERSDSIDFEAQLWIAGQIAALDASLALLESRTATRSPMKVWPEFAALDCSACHQSLRTSREGYSATHSPRIAGLSPWNRFGVELFLKLREASDGSRNSADHSLTVSLRQLVTLIGDRVTPDARIIQTAASNTRSELDRWLAQSGHQAVQSFSVEQLKCLAAESLRDRQSLASWEYAAQGYLAAIASRKAWPCGESPPAVAEAQQLRQSLLFRHGSNHLAVPDEPRRGITEKAQSLADLLSCGDSPPVCLPERLASPLAVSNLDDDAEFLLKRAPAPLRN